MCPEVKLETVEKSFKTDRREHSHACTLWCVSMSLCSSFVVAAHAACRLHVEGGGGDAAVV